VVGGAVVGGAVVGGAVVGGAVVGGAVVGGAVVGGGTEVCTAIACWAWGARWYFALPAWLASMTQLPGRLKVTTEPEIEHVEVFEGSMVKITRLPEAPPTAATR